MSRFGSDFGRFWAPKSLPKNLGHAPPFCILKAFVFHVMLCIFPRGPKSRPRGPKTPPRAPQDAPRGPQEHPRRLQESIKRPQEPVKRGQDPPRNPKRLQKTKKTLKISEIDISQRPCPKSQNEKRRAGGGDPPWGSQSVRRPPLVGGAGRAGPNSKNS